MRWKQGNKPVIGIIGGIGAGKSAVAHCFAAEGVESLIQTSWPTRHFKPLM